MDPIRQGGFAVSNNPFLKTAIIATLGYFIAGRVPFLHGVLGWIVLIGAPFLYVRWKPSISAMTSPLGYSLGMGALIGAIANEAGTVLTILFEILAVAIGAGGHTATSGLAVLGAGVGGAFALIHLLYGPFVGAVLGLFGGLIAGSMLPKSPSN